MERFYLCPVCQNYVSKAAKETCETCLVNPPPKQKLKSKNLHHVRKEVAAKPDRSVTEEKSSSLNEFFDNLHPLNYWFVITIALGTFLVALMNGNSFERALLFILFSPGYAFAIWLFFIISRVVIEAGYGLGAEYADRRGFGKIGSILCGLLGVIFFTILFIFSA